MNLEELKKQIPKGRDLSLEEDLAIGVMNLIAIEEHLFHTAAKTGNGAYLDMLHEMRSMRTKLLAQLLPDWEGEEWCTCKHLLAASKRLEESAVKLLPTDRKRAEQLAAYGADLFAYFFAISLKLIGTKELKIDAEAKKTGKFAAMIRSIVDCCKEW